MRKVAALALIVLAAGCPKRGGTFNPRSRFEVPKSGDARALQRFEEARNRFERQDFTTDAEFEAIAREFPNDPIVDHAKLYAGMASCKKGEYPEAVKILQPFADDPKVAEDLRARARFFLGVSLAYVGQHEQALTLLAPFEGKLASGDDEGELYAALAESARATGRPDKALHYYDEYFARARPAEREYVAAQVRMVVDALPAEAVKPAWEAADKTRPAAAYLGLRLATTARDPGEARSYLEASAQARQNLGLVDDSRGAASGNADAQLVGALFPLTGKTRVVGDQALRGLAVAAGTFQVGGGAAGTPRPFTVLVRDSAASGQARAALDQLVQAGAIAVVGPVDRGAAEEAARRADAAGLPIVSLDVSDSPIVQGSAHVFRIVVPVEARARALARAAVAKGSKSFALLVPEHSYGARGAQAFRDEVEKQGARVVAEERYKKDATSFVDPVKKLAGRPFDALFIPDTAQRLELIAPQLAVANLVVQAPGGAKAPRGSRAIVLLSTAEALAPEFLKGSGRYTQGAILAPGFYPDDTDQRTQPFVLRFRAAYGKMPDYLAAYAWDAALVIRAAVEAGARDRGSLTQAIPVTKVAGVTGDVAFSVGRGRADAGMLYMVAQGGASIRVWRP